jgi:hypothetical protein
LQNKLQQNQTITYIDYKENINLSVGPTETQAGWFQKTGVTVLGFLTIFADEAGTNKKLIRTILSYNLNHDAFFTNFCLEEVFSIYP